MRGLESIPTVQQLAMAYGELSSRSIGIDASRMALLSQWARFDPRLAELMASWIAANWNALNPVALNAAVSASTWPAAMGVILEQVAALLLPRGRQRRMFRFWAATVMHGISRAPNEMFFIGTMAPGGKMMLKAAATPHRTFTKWGYLGNDLFMNKSSQRMGSTLVPREQRQVVLAALFKGGRRITVSDYMDALDGGVSRRQAELDLKRVSGVRAHGNTRARTYFKPHRS